MQSLILACMHNFNITCLPACVGHIWHPVIVCLLRERLASSAVTHRISTLHPYNTRQQTGLAGQQLNVCEAVMLQAEALLSAVSHRVSTLHPYNTRQDNKQEPRPGSQSLMQAHNSQQALEQGPCGPSMREGMNYLQP